LRWKSTFVGSVAAQALVDGQLCAEVPLGLGVVAHRHHEIPQLDVGDRQVALEPGVGGVGGGQALGDG